MLLLVFDASGSWLVVGTMTDKLLQTIDLIDRSDVVDRMQQLGPPRDPKQPVHDGDTTENRIGSIALRTV